MISRLHIQWELALPQRNYIHQLKTLFRLCFWNSQVTRWLCMSHHAWWFYFNFMWFHFDGLKLIFHIKCNDIWDLRQFYCRKTTTKKMICSATFRSHHNRNWFTIMGACVCERWAYVVLWLWKIENWNRNKYCKTKQHPNQSSWMTDDLSIELQV